jgi:hypothetical protein
LDSVVSTLLVSLSVTAVLRLTWTGERPPDWPEAISGEMLPLPVSL